MRVAIIGGGAAGFFGAIEAASGNPAIEVDILEAGHAPLQKVRISGGGRCNVTHHCFEPRELATAYPRGGRALIGPFTRFGPRETMAWFEARGVPLKVEADGRVFPESDRSSSVVDCLMREAVAAGVRLRLHANVRTVTRTASATFRVGLGTGAEEEYDRLLLASGGGPTGHRLAAALGHTIVPAVPSLFTFNVSDSRLRDLAGLSFARVELAFADGPPGLRHEGPMLITHWGLSGPAVLRLSAWGARWLADRQYHATLLVNFVPDASRDAVLAELTSRRSATPAKRVRADRVAALPARYWSRIVDHVGVAADAVWSQVSTALLGALATELTGARIAVRGRGVFKEEFVTAGGVSLAEVDFRTMASRVVAGLHLAGEVLDVDGITGGFNFQSAWTTGWIAGKAMAEAG